MNEIPRDHVKFVVAGSVALFESWVNGRMRVWEHPVKRKPRLIETTDSYTVPGNPYEQFRV